MTPCHPFRPVPGQCGPSRRGPLPAPPFDPRDYWATRKSVSELSASLEKKLDKADVVDPGEATEAGQAADAKKTQEELNGILAKLAKKADSATTLEGYGITDAATKAEIAAKADLVGGKVPAAQLPSYVDDVLEYGSKSEFPASGENSKIYVAKDTNLVYRWSGTQYVEISPSPTLDDAVTETSSNGVKSSGIWSWVKSLLPKWLTSDYAEPATVESVEAKADKTELEGFATEADLLAFYYPDGSVTSMGQITASGIEYAVGDDGGAYIAAGSGLSGHVVLPWKVTINGDEYKVTAIGGSAFSDNSFTGLTAPTTVKVIKDNAFDRCTSLTTVNLPSVTSIGINAFSYCHSLTSINLPSATSIGESTFFKCDFIKSVSLPSATTINDGAFDSCHSLESVSITSATSIGIYAFNGCGSLTTIDFGSSPKSAVPSLGSFAFEGVPTSCKFIIPIGMYDEWISASMWSNLYAQGYKFDGYASTDQLANKAGKSAPSAAGNLAALTANGDLLDSGKKPSDFRETTDNACHQSQLGNVWTCDPPLPEGYEIVRYSEGISGWQPALNGNSMGVGKQDPGNTATTLAWAANEWQGGYAFTATRTTVAKSGEPFVTEGSISTNNPAFVSAVQNTPTSGMPDDMPTDLGTYGTVGAALAALAAGLKWCKNILGSLASGYSTFAAWIASKLDRASLLTEYSATSAYSVGAIVYRDGSIYQCKTAIAEGGEAWNSEHWELRKLDGFFTNSNSLLNGRLAYSRNETGLKDRAFNTLSFDGTEYNLSTALAAVTPTASGQPRDLLIVATATAATTISFTAGTIKGDKPTIDGSGTWLITLTEYASGVWYCRQIKMEDAA